MEEKKYKSNLLNKFDEIDILMKEVKGKLHNCLGQLDYINYRFDNICSYIEKKEILDAKRT